MSFDQLKIALCQLQSNENLAQNVSTITELVNSYGPENDIIAFPENSTYIRVSSREKFFGALEITDKFFRDMESLSGQLDVVICLGGVPLKEGNDLVNATVWVEPNQPAQVVYRKIHMFDVNVGDHAIRESDTFTPGGQASIREFKGWRFGFSICYDVRFANIYELYARQQVDVVFVPAAFLVPTGKAHWQVLLRARAIEGQFFVVAPAQAGEHWSVDGKKSRLSYGHSLAVSPWGEVLMDLNNRVNVAESIELSKKTIQRVQNQIPMCDHRKANITLEE